MKEEDKGNLQEQLNNAIPRWAIATCAVMFCLAMTMKIVGIDLSKPVNSYFDAKVLALENKIAKENRTNVELVKLLDRIKVLEIDSHASSHKK